jgi:phosphatidylserine/phosphatidylglycerophosphate/cardiolipin synthase-like enzyme
VVAFLNTSNAYAQIEQIIDKATTEVVLISPYIRFPKPLLERLKYKDGQGIKTIVVCREKELDKDLGAQVRSDLKQLKHLELRFDDDLHAKCFFSQESMVITSLNLLESSERKNREMGVLLSSKEDAQVFKEARDEAKYIVDRAQKDSAIRSIVSGIVKEAKSVMDTPFVEEPRRARTQSRDKLPGYCIRCGRSIAYALKEPYCLDCYRVWNKWKNPEHKETYCHSCGKPRERITMAKPLCATCYKKQ